VHFRKITIIGVGLLGGSIGLASDAGTRAPDRGIRPPPRQPERL